MSNYMTLSDIRTAIERSSKQFSGKKEPMLNYLINMVYLSEIMSVDSLYPFFWLIQSDITRKSVSPAAITWITKANPCVVTAVNHGFSTGDIISFYGITGMTGLNGIMAQVTKLTSDSFSISVDSTSYTTYISNGYAYHRGITCAAAQIDYVLTAGWNEYHMMEPLNPDDIEKNINFHNNDNTAGPPTHYLFGKSLAGDGSNTNQIIWFPATDNEYLLRYTYKQPVARLVNDTDVPMLPSQYHDIIVSGVMARLVESKENISIENASLWPTIYQSHLAALKQYNQEYWSNVEQNKKVSLYML